MTAGRLQGDVAGVEYREVGDVAVLILSDPSTLNAVSPMIVDTLRSHVDRAAHDARAILLTGAGRAFCSGAKLGEGVDMDDPNYDAGAVLDSHYNPLIMALRDCPVPIVTAVNGAAAGIGCSLALAGDIILASDTAYFLQAFRRIGLVPDGGTSWLLTRAIGRTRAMEMMLLGEKLPAAKALEWGLISRVVPAADLYDQAVALAADLAAGPTGALALIRQQCWRAAEMDFVDTLAMERRQQCEAGRTSDHREGIAAFLGKRLARFTGR